MSCPILYILYLVKEQLDNVNDGQRLAPWPFDTEGAIGIYLSCILDNQVLAKAKGNCLITTLIVVYC